MYHNETERKVAYCIPTYNHPAIIKGVLQRCASLYQEMGIDVYLYDSSTNEETKEVVDAFLEKGIHNLYYVRISPEIWIDEKLLMIFSGYGLLHKYKYIWPVKDRNFADKPLLEAVLEEAEKDYEAIFLEVMDTGICETEKPGRVVYSEAAEFYKDWAWLATSMDVTLFRTDTLLSRIDWEEFQARYFWNGENQFDHFTVLFHGLAQKEKSSVCMLYGKNIYFYTMKSGGSMWIKDIFNIWGNLWLKVNHAFPSCYDKYKERVIHQGASLSWIFGSQDQLVNLKQQGILTEQAYEEIKERWEKLSDVPVEELKMIAYGKWQEYEAMLLDRINELLTGENYEELDKLYRHNLWLGKDGENKEYLLLGECLEIYQYERNAETDRCIFYHVWNYKDAANRITDLTGMLHQIEQDAGWEEQFRIKDYIIKNRVSVQCLLILIEKKCVEKEQVLCKLVNLLKR